MDATARRTLSAVRPLCKNLRLRRMQPDVRMGGFALPIRYNSTATASSVSSTSISHAPPPSPSVKSSQLSEKPDWPSALPIPRSTLSSLLARLGLPTTPKLLNEIENCLTDRSWDPSKVPSLHAQPFTSSSSTAQPTNDLLSALGNSLLGLFASEHLATMYPNLPTRALKAAVTAYVGPTALASVAREFGIIPGIHTTGGAEDQLDTQVLNTPKGYREKGRVERSLGGVAGVPVRWLRREAQLRGMETQALVEESEQADASRDASEIRDAQPQSWSDVVSRVARSFVGLVYQENGIHAARDFVHAHFLSRHLDVSSLLNFRNPKHALASEIRKMMAEQGVAGSAAIQSRLLAETGRQTMSPVFCVGLFLPSGIKLAEGHGSSLRMAEHRAAVNALTSIYTVRGELQSGWLSDIGKRSESPSSSSSTSRIQVPTEAHSDFPLQRPGNDLESHFRGNVELSRSEALFGSR